MLPILHLNGYKIANPTVLARIPRRGAARRCFEGYGYEPYFVEGDDPATMHQLMAATLDEVRRRDPRASSARRATGGDGRAAALADDRAAHAEGLDRARRRSTASRPRARSARTRCRSRSSRENPEHLALLEEWMRSYRPEELFDETGALVPELAALAPEGERRMGANPHANGGLLLRDLELPDFRDYAVDVPRPATVDREATRVLGALPARRDARQRPTQLPPLRPRRDGVQPPRRACSRSTDRGRGTAEIAADRRAPRAATAASWRC